MKAAHFSLKPWCPITLLQGVISYRTTMLIVEWRLVVNSCSSRTATDTFVITNFTWTAMEMNMDLHSDTHLSYWGCVMIPNSLVIWYQHTRQTACFATPKTTDWITTSIKIHVSYVCMCDLHHTYNHLTCVVPSMWQSQMYYQHCYFRTLCLLMMVSTVQAHLSSVILGLLDARVKLQFVIHRTWVRAAANNRVCSACLASRRSKWLLWSLGLWPIFSHAHNKQMSWSLTPKAIVQPYPQ